MLTIATKSQSANTGQDIAYTHYNNGYIQSIHDKALGMYTYFEYDYDGNKTFEGYISLKNPVSIASGAKDYYQYANISYDAQNRITSILDPKANISYEYDAVGNRRRVRSYYHDGVNGTQRTQDFWYTFDAMSRFTTTMGSLAVTATGVATTTRGASAADTTITINKGAAGGAGVAISYNAAGERAQAINAIDGTTENYTYTADGYLMDVKINNVLRSRRVNDALGRTTNLTQYNASGVADYSKATVYDADNRVTSESGTDGPTTYYYGANGGDLARTTNVNGGTTINTYYGYEYWDDAKITAIQAQAYNPKVKKNNRIWRPGYSDISYDVNGHISGAVDYVGNRHFTYINDSNGQIMVRDEITGARDRVTYRTKAYQDPGSVASKITRYYYVDGKRVGDISNDGPSRTDYAQALANRKAPQGNYANWRPVESADFDQNYEPISPTYPGNVASSYTVKNGDTLQSIARTVWGDSAMWYLIADANGLASGSTLTAGQVLTIPNKVSNIHNNAGTFRPYNPGEAIGDTSPTIPVAPSPPKKKKKCGGFLAIIVAVVAVVATIYTAGAASIALGSAASGATTFAAGTAALGGASLGAAVIGGAVGSIAGQLAGLALGVQDKFNWGAVAAGAIGAGIGAAGGINIGSGVPGQIASAIAGNIINQGVGIITGAQKGFSWAGVAAAAIAAPITSRIGNDIKNSSFANASPLNAGIAGAAAGVINSTVNELTRVAISGGKLNWASVAIGGIQGGIYGYGEGLGNQAKIKANILSQNSAFTGERINVAGGVGRTDSPQVRVGGDAALERTEAYRKANPNASADELQSIYASASQQPDLLSTNPSEGGLSIKAGAADSVKNKTDNLNTANAINKTSLSGVDKAFSNIAADAVNQYYDIKDAYALGDQIKFNRALYERALSDTGQSRFTEPAQNPINLRVNNFLASQQSLASSLDNYATYGSIAFENAGKVGPLKNLIPMPYKQSLVANASLVDGASQFVDRNGKTATLLTNNAKTYGAAARGLSGVGNVLSVYDEFSFNQSVVLSSPNRQALVNTSSVVSLSGDVVATATGARVGTYVGVGLSAIPQLTAFSPYIIPTFTVVGGGLGHYIYDNPIKEGVRQFFGLPKEIEKK